MAHRRIVACVVLVVITAAFLLPHSHKNWNGQGCELCHVQNLPSLSSPIASGLAVPIVIERYRQAAGQAAEVDGFLARASSLAPPLPHSFTV
jgi:hypothetical protein